MDWADQRWQLGSWGGNYWLKLALVVADGMLKLMLHTTTSRYIVVI